MAEIKHYLDVLVNKEGMHNIWKKGFLGSLILASAE